MPHRLADVVHFSYTHTHIYRHGNKVRVVNAAAELGYLESPGGKKERGKMFGILHRRAPTCQDTLFMNQPADEWPKISLAMVACTCSFDDGDR